MKVPPGQAGQKCRCARCNAEVLAPAQEFGFECWLCRSRLYARPEQIGQEVTCPDCHSKNTVKAPKAQAKPPAAADDDDDALQLSEPVERLPAAYVAPADSGHVAGGGPPATDSPPVAAPRPSGGRDVMGDQARKVMAKAEAEVEEVERTKPRLPDRPFVTGLVSFLHDSNAVLRWLMLTLMLHADVALFRWIIELSAGSGVAQVFAVLMILVAALLGLAFVATASACFLAILQDTANGYDKPEHWPGTQITDWMMDVFYVVNGLLAAALPGLFLGGALMCLGGKVLSAVYGGAISAIALFPIFLISMATEGSCFAVASPAVWGTLRTARQRWGKFYLLSAGLGLVLVVLARWMAGGGFFLTGLGAAAAVAVMMIYFRLLGRLAWCLSEQRPS